MDSTLIRLFLTLCNSEFSKKNGFKIFEFSIFQVKYLPDLHYWSQPLKSLLRFFFWQYLKQKFRTLNALFF